MLLFLKVTYSQKNKKDLFFTMNESDKRLDVAEFPEGALLDQQVYEHPLVKR